MMTDDDSYALSMYFSLVGISYICIKWLALSKQMYLDILMDMSKRNCIYSLPIVLERKKVESEIITKQGDSTRVFYVSDLEVEYWFSSCQSLREI